MKNLISSAHNQEVLPSSAHSIHYIICTTTITRNTTMCTCACCCC